MDLLKLLQQIMLAHMDNLDEIMKGITMLMDKGSIFVFEVSYLIDVVDKVLLALFFMNIILITGHTLNTF